MRLTDRQAQAYRELVDEMGPEDAVAYWRENVAGHWREWSKPLTRDEQMLLGFVTMPLIIGTIAHLARNPDVIRRIGDDAARLLQAATGAVLE